MKTLVLRNTDNSLRVEYKVDLINADSDNFTVMEIVGLDEVEEKFGLDLTLTTNSVTEIKALATTNNLILDLVDIDPAVGTTNLVAEGTSLAITTTSPMDAGTVAVEEEVEITCPADSSGSLGGTHFLISSKEGDFYVWFNVDGGSTDPAPYNVTKGDITGVEVAIFANDANTVVAAAVESALDALDEFGASAASEVVTVTNATAGAVTAASDVDSGCTFSQTQEGTSYSDTVEFEGGNMVDGENPVFAVESGSLPTGTELNASTGEIAGEPSAADTYTFTVSVTDSFGQSVSKELSIVIS